MATVMVAVAAIIVSSRFNVLTLRRSAAQFEQQRRDQMTDKLRVELSEYTEGLYQRWALSTLTAPLAKAGPDEASFKAAKTLFLRAVPDALEVRQHFNNLGMHGVVIMMLTTDATINRLILRINDEILAEKDDWFALSQIFTDTTDSGVRLADNAKAFQAERERREKSVYDLSDELMAYCVVNFAQPNASGH
ncbi:hypothetical protein A5782_21665 [Mycobacterium sp. 852002-40037_SCH5390672]|nr:hypothetical protein A5782_21665 [Mycobacterium sp. 852002-40037_SCH5390672]